MDLKTRRTTATFLMAMLASFTLATATGAYAQTGQRLDNTIGLQGEDQSQNLGAVNNLGQTVVSFILNVVAKVIGVAIAIWGITDFVKREVMWGTVKVFLCGACFFLNKIIFAMSQMGGGGNG